MRGTKALPLSACRPCVLEGTVQNCDCAHPYGAQDVHVDIEGALMHSCRQGWVQALRETLCHDELVRDVGKSGIGLQAL